MHNQVWRPQGGWNVIDDMNDKVQEPSSYQLRVIIECRPTASSLQGDLHAHSCSASEPGRFFIVRPCQLTLASGNVCVCQWRRQQIPDLVHQNPLCMHTVLMGIHTRDSSLQRQHGWHGTDHCARRAHLKFMMAGCLPCAREQAASRTPVSPAAPSVCP